MADDVTVKFQFGVHRVGDQVHVCLLNDRGEEFQRIRLSLDEAEWLAEQLLSLQ